MKHRKKKQPGREGRREQNRALMTGVFVTRNIEFRLEA